MRSDEREECSGAEPRSREWLGALMGAALPTLVLILAGVLVGGAWSLHRQGAPRGAVLVTALLAVLATVAGVLWLIPGQNA
ncbi:hypothetical protein ACFOW4_20310 [Micromonospora sp. GCM10011542]|uniref:hypothetical protein n=1 Tax=Micromonospora sp. GCM10011542 TaxID=3317337 RepID=UPI003612B1C2